MQKVVNVDAKVNLKSSIMVWDLDAYCSRGYRPSHNISLKVQTQGSKNFFYSKKFKPKDLKLALSHDNVAKLTKKKNRKDKEKRFQSQNWEHTKKSKRQTPSIGINTTNILKKKKETWR